VAARERNLYKNFRPDKYSLEADGAQYRLIISGQKTGPPSRRISLHQKNIRVISAIINRVDRKGPVSYRADRINHLRTFEQVRLHTKEVLYPGRYQIDLKYRPGLKKLKDLKLPSRSYLPSIDEPEAWANAEVEIK
jgi:hypothetical protein